MHIWRTKCDTSHSHKNYPAPLPFISSFIISLSSQSRLLSLITSRRRNCLNSPWKMSHWTSRHHCQMWPSSLLISIFLLSLSRSPNNSSTISSKFWSSSHPFKPIGVNMSLKTILSSIRKKIMSISVSCWNKGKKKPNSQLSKKFSSRLNVENISSGSSWLYFKKGLRDPFLCKL